ncbi:MAG: hypothetical protein IT454_23590 [Planctomycetes bacterium]|nr:hypothetical protein [Planctomycetota bacterium]
MAVNLDGSKRGNPNVAALLSWFVPGAGHVYLGSFGWGLALFALTDGLYWLGLQLSHGMSFEFLDPELRTVVAPILSPEIGNLGGVLWQMKHFGYGPGFPRPWPEGIVLGSMLSASAGMLNGLVMCHAHTLARAGSSAVATRPVLSTALAWLVPGLGHFHQGRKLRGAVVFVLLVGLFALGSAMAEGSNLSRERHFYYWAGQFVMGLPAIVSELVWGGMRVTRDIPYVEAGLVFGCVAGLLNVLAMLDVYAFGEARAFGWPLKSGHPDAGSSVQSGHPDAGSSVELGSSAVERGASTIPSTQTSEQVST